MDVLIDIDNWLKSHLSEIRNWLAFIFTAVGGFIAIRTYLSNQKQRRLENSFRLIAMFKESLHEDDIKAWRSIFQSSSEPAGAKDGYFVDLVDEQYYQRPFSDLFSEGSPDKGAIERMAEFFDLISYEALNETIDLRLIYFQIGQLMDTTYSWLEKIDSPEAQSTFLQEYYPYFDKLYRTNLIDKKWKKRTYEHIG